MVGGENTKSELVSSTIFNDSGDETTKTPDISNLEGFRDPDKCT